MGAFSGGQETCEPSLPVAFWAGQCWGKALQWTPHLPPHRSSMPPVPPPSAPHSLVHQQPLPLWPCQCLQGCLEPRPSHRNRPCGTFAYRRARHGWRPICTTRPWPGTPHCRWSTWAWTPPLLLSFLTWFPRSPGITCWTWGITFGICMRRSITGVWVRTGWQLGRGSGTLAFGREWHIPSHFPYGRQ